ncbi:hypothetical protein BKA93DRAFT_119540 [Sparassis latifolia]
MCVNSPLSHLLLSGLSWAILSSLATQKLSILRHDVMHRGETTTSAPFPFAIFSHVLRTRFGVRLDGIYRFLAGFYRALCRHCRNPLAKPFSTCGDLDSCAAPFCPTQNLIFWDFATRAIKCLSRRRVCSASQCSGCLTNSIFCLPPALTQRTSHLLICSCSHSLLGCRTFGYRTGS